MDALKAKLLEQLDIDDIIGDKIVEIVLNFVKDKLPENLQGLAESLIQSDEKPDLSDLLAGGSEGGLGNAIDIAKNLFGKS